MKEVTMVFKSGAKASFTVEQFKTIINGFGSIEKIEWDTKGLSKQLVHLNKHNIDAIFVEEVAEEEPVKEPDHPIEDFYGCEIQQDDKYFMFGQDVVLKENLADYLIEQQNVECFKAV
ncbi:YqaI family protein [Bacillus paranthracis]|uniref:YqaI family protein n=1 Tax=Bacillus paranthracis TaxID=2026186 RepID=UPI003980B972